MTASLPDILRTSRLVLRRPDLDDLEAYAAYYTGPRTGGVGGPKPRHQVAERFAAMAGQWALRGFGRYVISEGGRGFGHVGVMQIDAGDAPELTWTLWDGTREGRGYATEAARAVLDAWRGPDLIARVVAGNAASCRVAEKLGFAVDRDAVPPAHLSDELVTFRHAGVPV
jgi:RimJ/RimL family protein N-acetyltransferase